MGVQACRDLPSALHRNGFEVDLLLPNRLWYQVELRVSWVAVKVFELDLPQYVYIVNNRVSLF